MYCIVFQAKTTFHGHELVDYQGRSWVVPPSGIRAEKGECQLFDMCLFIDVDDTFLFLTKLFQCCM